jgi:hypothetical protein
MKKEQPLKSHSYRDGSMRNIVRAGLGFIGGLCALFGIYSLQSRNYIVGVVAVVIGFLIFWYAYKG